MNRSQNLSFFEAEAEGLSSISEYNEINPLSPDYEDRRDLYNLYHLLNHLNLFGGSHLGSVKSLLRRTSR